MEWRCEWCGKPHEENDPPCDNCGHGKFEEAVVRQTDLAEQEREATLVWVCTECGREHPKHAPPCSRCGNATLEKQRQEIDESELSSPGYLDLLTPQYAVLFAGTALLALVFVLGFAGVIDVPGFGGHGVPDVEGVPGNATSADGLEHRVVEISYLDEVDGDRTTRGLEPFGRSEGLDEVAIYYNQRRVKWRLGGGEFPEGETVGRLLSRECAANPEVYTARMSLEDGETATGAGEQLAQSVISSGDWRPDDVARTTGIDVHYADGRLYLTQFVCAS